MTYVLSGRWVKDLVIHEKMVKMMLKYVVHDAKTYCIFHKQMAFFLARVIFFNLLAITLPCKSHSSSS